MQASWRCDRVILINPISAIVELFVLPMTFTRKLALQLLDLFPVLLLTLGKTVMLVNATEVINVPGLFCSVAYV